MTVSRRSFLAGAASTAVLGATGSVGAPAGEWCGWTDRSFLAVNPQVAERTFACTRTRLSIAEFAEMVRTGRTTLEKAREEWPNLVLGPAREPVGEPVGEQALNLVLGVPHVPDDAAPAGHDAAA